MVKFEFVPKTKCVVYTREDKQLPMRDFLATVLILASVAGLVYSRAKLWSALFPDDDYFPLLGPKKIQTLFGDEDQKKPD